MNLKQYLKQLKECPDEHLRDKWGVSDNWPIFLNTDFDFVINYLKNSGKYNHKGGFTERNSDEVILGKGDPYDPKNLSFIDKDITRHFFNYVPGIVVLQVLNRVPLCNCNGSDEDMYNQKNDYNMQIMLHPYQNKVRKKEDEFTEYRGLANVISDLGEFVIKENIPTCMPQSIKSGKYPIVYHLKNKIK